MSRAWPRVRIGRKDPGLCDDRMEEEDAGPAGEVPRTFGGSLARGGGCPLAAALRLAEHGGPRRGARAHGAEPDPKRRRQTLPEVQAVAKVEQQDPGDHERRAEGPRKDQLPSRQPQQTKGVEDKRPGDLPGDHQAHQGR